MINVSQITVVFVCPSCGAGYQVTQKRLTVPSLGSFKCQVCRTEIYSWYGTYDYVDWAALETFHAGVATQR